MGLSSNCGSDEEWCHAAVAGLFQQLEWTAGSLGEMMAEDEADQTKWLHMASSSSSSASSFSSSTLLCSFSLSLSLSLFLSVHLATPLPLSVSLFCHRYYLSLSISLSLSLSLSGIIGSPSLYRCADGLTPRTKLFSGILD